MTTPWTLDAGPDEQAEERVVEGLVAHNQTRSAAIRERFRPENLPSRPVFVQARVDGEVVGGCAASTEDVWHWLTIDTMWVAEQWRGRGVGSALLAAVEQEARSRGCRWAKLNTWEFQAPAFYERCGYTEYAREVDYPPGHVNVLMRRDL